MTRYSSFPFLSLVVLVLVALGGCGASTPDVELTDDGDLATPLASGALRATEAGPAHVRLEGPIGDLAVGDFVALVPRGPWPNGDANKPAQVLLQVTGFDGDEADTIVLGQRDPTVDLATLEGRPTTRAAMTMSKSVTQVLSVSEHELRLDARSAEGVSPGDYFFVLGEAAAEPERLGSHIIGLIQVREVASTGSTAVILHQMGDIGPGSVAVFAHHAAMESERPEALILFAPTRPEGASGGMALPPLAEAVFDYQAQFQFSNIRIETLDTFIDPSTWDAPDRAQELAPDTGFGVIVFGQERPDDFLYNITTYGSPPSLATSVGILPGGLPLPTPDGLAALSRSLAPSFLATAMTQRGDHAEVIYFLEYCLRTQAIAGPVAFHLREHLALRYESIHRPVEGLWLMNHDLAEARATDNPYAELNALSIREYLHRELVRFDAELADLDAFLEAAEDVLPDESLLSERLEKSRVLGRLDRSAEALLLLDDVIQDARGQQRLRWEVSGTIARASLLFDAGDVDGAVNLLTDTLPNARVIGESYPRYCHALLAQFLAQQNRNDEALLNMQAAIAYASTDDAEYSMASTFELAATLYYNFEDLAQSVLNMREAANLYGELQLFDDAARAFMQAGMLELNATVQAGDPTLLEDAYDHLGKSADTYMAIGDGAAAAQAYGAMAMVNALLRRGAQSAAQYNRTIELGSAYDDPETVAAAYQRLAELYYATDQVAQGQLAIQSARLWAEAFGLTEILEDLQVVERENQDAI